MVLRLRLHHAEAVRPIFLKPIVSVISGIGVRLHLAGVPLLLLYDVRHRILDGLHEDVEVVLHVLVQILEVVQGLLGALLLRIFSGILLHMRHLIFE